MPILEICSMMLLLDCSNSVVHSMALKHDSDSPDYKRICISWNKSVRNILRLPYTTHTWIRGPLLGQPHIHCQHHLVMTLHILEIVTVFTFSLM